MNNLVQARLEVARKGENSTVVCRAKSGWVVLGDWQLLPGYSILIADPVVGDLHLLPMDHRLQFLRDMTVLGEALVKVTAPLRVNYQILGNLDTQLHAHVYPRYRWEEESKQKRSTAFYDKKAGPHFYLGDHAGLKQRLPWTMNQLSPDIQ